jgi:trehalose 6-phosphate phosphatase
MSRLLFDALSEIGDRLAQASHVLLCLDFDGTLTPFVVDPNRVFLAEDTRRVLRGLSQIESVSPVVFSGRALADLKARVELPGVICVGNHGLEIGGPGLYFLEPGAAMFRPAIQELAATLAAQLQAVPGAAVEEKGLTLSVHYRQVPKARWDEVNRLVHAALADATHPFLLTAGSMVYEIRPRVYWTKASAVTWLQQRLGEDDLLTIYLGDDYSDEEAFAAIHDGVTVKVGEVPETAAMFYLDEPAEVHAFLEWLFKRVREQQMQLSR